VNHPNRRNTVAAISLKGHRFATVRQLRQSLLGLATVTVANGPRVGSAKELIGGMRALISKNGAHAHPIVTFDAATSGLPACECLEPFRPLPRRCHSPITRPVISRYALCCWPLCSGGQPVGGKLSQSPGETRGTARSRPCGPDHLVPKATGGREKPASPTARRPRALARNFSQNVYWCFDTPVTGLVRCAVKDLARMWRHGSHT
jgi:hypothetical protein